MTNLEPLGLDGIEAIHFYVKDLERSRRFYTELLDFAEIGRSSDELEARSGQKSAVFRAGEATIVCSQPVTDGGQAWRFLQRHPDGVGSLTMRVADVERTWRLLLDRGATPTSDIQRFEDGTGQLAFFSITTPFGDTTFRFAERRGFAALYPGMEIYGAPKGGENRFGFRTLDHVTSNFLTLRPAMLWLEQVLGFEKFWQVEFHTNDVAEGRDSGSGLRSQVMVDPKRVVKLANNEPLRPFFRTSQISVFNEEHNGDGVQHLALDVDDIIPVVRELRSRGVRFMPTPGTYFDMLPERLERLGVQKIDEDIDTLRELEILVDGGAPRTYLLQIFLEEGSRFHDDKDAGPFFLEIIQRKGDEGFGAGNFRALFESIERQQRADGRA